jgi:Protein of unknown function (DUF4241)
MSDIALPPCEVPVVPVATTGGEWQQQHATWLYDGIRAGALLESEGPSAGQRLPVVLEVLGEIPLPDGRLIVGDPYLCQPDTLPLVERVPPGAHPVATALVEVEEDHRRETALLLVAGSAPIVRWSLALTEPAPGTRRVVPDTSTFGVGEFVGHAVEMGTSAIFSPDARDARGHLFDQDIGMFDDPLTKAMDASMEARLVQAAMAPPRADGGLPVAACRAGWGDGMYPTWLGHAADGSVVVVMSDFMVLGDPSERG